MKIISIVMIESYDKLELEKYGICMDTAEEINEINMVTKILIYFEIYIN